MFVSVGWNGQATGESAARHGLVGPVLMMDAEYPIAALGLKSVPSVWRVVGHRIVAEGTGRKNATVESVGTSWCPTGGR